MRGAPVWTQSFLLIALLWLAQLISGLTVSAATVEEIALMNRPDRPETSN